jgi:renalase
LQTWSNTKKQVCDVAIIGAGICGLTIASELSKQKNRSWLMVDKARSVGGRMATRRVDGEKFDHGAQFFTARSKTFQTQVTHWINDAVVKEWVKGFNHSFNLDLEPQVTDDRHWRYIGVEGMNQVAKHMAAMLGDDRILTNEKILYLKLEKNGLVLVSENGLEIEAQTVVVTSPLPQTIDMVKHLTKGDFDEVRTQLSSVSYNPCIALLGFFDPEEVPLDALPIQCIDSSISFLSDNFKKGISSRRGSLTVHLSAEVSRHLFATDEQTIISYICQQLELLFKVSKVTPPKVTSIQRWRYASPINTFDVPFIKWADPERPETKIYFAGEAFGGPKIEGAFLSGCAAAQDYLAEAGGK